jgi:3-deoxy-manno-octulosonate cytidylyltransferase (CMP-KDO synthetase)
MRVLAVIPARLGSTRFPGKPLARLRGRPLVQHVWEAVRRASGVDRVVVATDAPDIAAAARGFGAEAVMTRSGHPTGSDRVAEAALAVGGKAEIVVNVQGDEPLLVPEAVQAAVAALDGDPAAAAATLAVRDDDRAAFASRHVVKVACDLEGRALYFSRAPLGDAAQLEPPASGGRAAGGPGWSFLRHVGLYAFRREALAAFAGWPPSPLERAEALEQLRLLEHGLRMRVAVTSYRSRGVDTPEDLAALERDWDRLVASAGGSAREPGEARP